MRKTQHILGTMLVVAALAGCKAPETADTPFPTPYPFITATPQPQPQSSPTLETPETLPTQPVETATDTPTSVETLPEGADQDSPTPTSPSRPGVGCRYQAQAVFAQVYQNDPGLPSSLGCPIGQTSGERPRMWPVTIIFQPFERGYMIWASNLGWIRKKAVLVLLDDHTFSRYDDTFTPPTGTPGVTATSPGDPLEPVGALGRVWGTQPGLSQRIGFATAQPSPAETLMQVFEYGHMIHISPTGQVVVLKQGQPGSWSIHAVEQ